MFEASIPINFSNMTSAEQEALVHDLLTRFRLYTSFGVAVVVANLIVIIVHVSNKEMNKRYILFTMLSVAELVNGISFIATGVGREMQMHLGTYFNPIRVHECLMWFPWPTLLIFAGQLPAAMNLMLATERVIAVQCAGWYRRVWTWKHKSMLGIFGWLLCVLGFGLAIVAAHFSDHINSTRICAVMEATGIIYGSIHFALISLAYLISFIVLFVIFMITRASKKPSQAEIRRQKVLFAVIGVSVVFVSFPNCVLIFNEWKIMEAGALFVGIAYCLYAISSTFNLFIYIAFRQEFRSQLLILMCLKKKNEVNKLFKTTTLNMHGRMGQQARIANISSVSEFN
uniref:G_PROTEIN_RECEP_F1_2 domain-containing protein n=2 Tax=Steinernema glaseri TaxID=37863 RepID=A0A1I8A740_9BILA